MWVCGFCFVKSKKDISLLVTSHLFDLTPHSVQVQIGEEGGVL